MKNNTDLNTTIGVLNLYDGSSIITISGLKNEMRNGSYYSEKQYCDFRYGTNLTRFSFDPYTGEKIDWKEVKRILTEIQE